MGPEQAVEEVREHSRFSERALEELAEVHRSGVQRFADLLADFLPGRWEGRVAGIVVTVMLLLGGTALAGEQLRGTSAWLWPVAILGASVLGIALHILFGLHRPEGGALRRAREELTILLFTGLAGMMVGVMGIFIELYLALRRLVFETGGLWPMVVTWLLRGIPVVLLGLMVALVTGLIWFVLARRITALEQEAVGYLLGHPEAGGSGAVPGRI